MTDEKQLPRLSRATLNRVREGVAVPEYDLAKTQTGVIHFGPGSFFRSHVAWHFDRILAFDPNWGISAVSLRSGGLRAALAAQDDLYTLVALGMPSRYRIIGALREYLVAPDDPDAVFRRFGDSAVKLVTLTVTEKGYCLDANSGALDLQHADIRHDLAEPRRPQSLVGWLVEGLSRRNAANIAPLTIISCDNLADNGPKLKNAVISFAEARGEAELARWIANACRFPATMVDSITPHMTEALKREVAAATGLRDEAPIARERFTQWVIEDDLGPGLPDFARAGAVLTHDVRGYERAKLWLLNAAHSALAYLGLPRGYDTVDEAMADAGIAGFVEHMMREDVVPALKPGLLDYQAYIDAILARLRNPAIKHKLTKIAEDGSIKVPQRYFAVVGEALAQGRSIERLSKAIAAWLRFVVLESKAGGTLNDPLAAKLMALGRASNAHAAEDVPRFLEMSEVFPRSLATEARFARALETAYSDLAR